MTTHRWNRTITWKHRYNEIGVINLIQRLNKKELLVIDVGCSIGVAIKHCKKTLLKHGITIYTIGIDGQKNVWDKAENNVDQLVRCDAKDVVNYDKTADVVICINTVRFTNPDYKKNVLKKCITFLKQDGVLITNVESFVLKNTTIKFVNPNNITAQIFLWHHQTRMLDKINAESYIKNVTTHRAWWFRLIRPILWTRDKIG